MNPKVAAIYKESVRTLAEIYDETETKALINLVFEDLLGISRIERLTNRNLTLAASQSQELKAAIDSLRNGVPVQHLLGFAFFLDKKFLVNQYTLIPRQETEELVDLIIHESQGRTSQTILDIGTGTGCIPISLKLALPSAKVSSWDISEQALQVARQNAELHNAQITLEKKDVLTDQPDQSFDIIVSNPPYIPAKEHSSMHINVTAHEPAEALFVPDDDPLLFYRSIGQLGQSALNPAGKLYFEIHEDYGQEVLNLLNDQGYLAPKIIKDLNGKDRMVHTTKPPQ